MGKKGKRGKPKDSVTEIKKKELQKLWDFIQSLCDEYELHMDVVCSDICEKIRKTYNDKLKALPDNVRNLTLTQYFEMQKQDEQNKIAENEQYRSEFEK